MWNYTWILTRAQRWSCIAKSDPAYKPDRIEAIIKDNQECCTRLVKTMTLSRFARIFVGIATASSCTPAVASLLCEKPGGTFSAKLFAGSQIFTQSPSPSSSSGSYSQVKSRTSSSVYRDTSYSEYQTTTNNSTGPLAGGELIYSFPGSRVSLGTGYSYSTYDSSSNQNNTYKFSDAGSTCDPGVTCIFSNGQVSSSYSSVQTVDQTNIRLSGYYDLSKSGWRIKPYAIAAFVATNTRYNAYTSTLSGGSANIQYSDNTSFSGSTTGNDRNTSTTGTTSSWSFSPEIGVGFDVPVSKQVSLGSELRYIPTNIDSTMPINVLGYLKYNFVSSSTAKQTAPCETLEIKGSSAGAVKDLLKEASPSEIKELADYIKAKRQLNQKIQSTP
jgi:hypothetical protein